MTYYTSSKYYGRTRTHDNIVPLSLGTKNHVIRLLTIVREGTPDKVMIITDQLRHIEYITYP